jgi:putative ABC transport system substrate-binding protein
LRAGLREFGYAEGKNLTIEYRWAQGNYEELPKLVAELVDQKVEVIVTHGTPGTLAAKRAANGTPIVMAVSGDPVATGIVKSLARPDGNITGSTFFNRELGEKRLELLKEALPDVVRVGVLLNPDNAVMPQIFEAMGEIATQRKLSLRTFGARKADEIEPAFAAMREARVDACVVLEDGVMVANPGLIGSITSKIRLPAVGFTEVAEAGGLMSYGIDTIVLFRRAAYFIDRILKGAKPSDLPIERGSKFEMLINLRAARELGVTIPQSLLHRADRVIE